MHIAQFCNFINDAHTANGENILDASMAKPSVVTFLTGGKLIDKKLSSISFTGILDAIGIGHEQINDFYGKFKKKWTVFISYAESFCHRKRTLDKTNWANNTTKTYTQWNK